MALSKDVVIRMLGDSASAQKAIKAAADAAEVSVSAYRRAEREQSKQAAAAEAAAAKQRAAMESVGRGAMVMGAVVAAGLALSAKAAIDWESAWAGVVKTVDGTPEQMNELEGALRNLATTLPTTHEEIAGVAEAAGQLGIARGDIVEFTKVAIAMGVSTNLSAEDAATGLARLSNIMGTSSSDVDRMGSTLVALGNAGASTEGEILDMGLRIAAAGRQAGFSEGEVLGLANAMSSLGIEAEAGGTAISMVIKSIGNAVSDGGDELDMFATVAGTTSEKFAAAWRKDAASALVTVIEGLARMQAQGQNVNGVIDDLGLGGIRTSDTLLRLAGNADGLAESLATGNEAWAENSALMNEANKRYETTASKIAIARNQITDAAIDIGGVLLPVLAKGAEMIADFARGFQDLPGWMQDSIVVIGTLAAVVGLVGGAALIAVPKIMAFRTEMTVLATSSGAASGAVGRFGLFMTGPWGAALGIATLALGGLVTWLGSSSRASQESTNRQRDLASALRDTGGVIDENIRAMRAQAAVDKDIGDSNLLEVAAKAGVSLPRLTDALVGNRDAYGEVKAALDAYVESQTRTKDMVSRGGGEPTFLTSQGRAAKEAQAALSEMVGEMGGAVAENERLAAATEKSGGAAKSTTTSMDSLAAAQDDVAGSGKDAATAAEELADAIDALNGPTLNLRDATREYQAQLDDITEAMKADGWKKTLDENTEAGRANAQMLDDLATKAMEQANAIAANGGSYDAFRNSLQASRQALVDSAIAMGATEEQAWALADQILQIPDAASVDVSVPTYGQVTAQLVDVYNKVKGVPAETRTNVGVLSADAIAKLQEVGYHTRTLPDGTVEVYADKATKDAAEAALNNVARRRTMVVEVVTAGGVHVSGGTGPGGTQTRASGGPIWPGTFLVGEKGPELVRFGQTGYVTPADQTSQILAALHQPAPSAPALAAIGAGQPAGGSTSTSYSRTFAPVFQVANARPMTARQLMDLARDEEFLHG